ncbi:MAG: glycosyltransferase family 4 protein [Opitutaceae bacterium]
MKVIQILPELNAGGVERGTLEVGKFLVEQGHESIVISNGGRQVEQLEAEGSRHITLPVHKKRLSSLKQVKVLRRLFETEKPDIIHLRSRLPAWLAYLAWRKMDPQTRPRLVTTVHGFNSVNAYSKIMTCGERVICVSNSVKSFVQKNYPSTDSHKLVVIHRGIDPTEYNPSFKPAPEWLDKWHADFPETSGKKLLTLPGRITRLKGHDDFLQIVNALKDHGYHGIIAGGAHPKKQDYLAEIKERAHALGLGSHVTFTGHRSDLKEVLSHSNIVLSLTQQPESFGRTTLEALSLGTPVIGYQHGGVGEILDKLFPQGKVETGNPQPIISLIQQWESDAEAREPAIDAPFTLSRMLDATISEYLKLSAATRA